MYTWQAIPLRSGVTFGKGLYRITSNHQFKMYIWMDRSSRSNLFWSTSGLCRFSSWTCQAECDNSRFSSAKELRLGQTLEGGIKKPLNLTIVLHHFPNLRILYLPVVRTCTNFHPRISDIFLETIQNLKLHVLLWNPRDKSHDSKSRLSRVSFIRCTLDDFWYVQDLSLISHHFY